MKYTINILFLCFCLLLVNNEALNAANFFNEIKEKTLAFFDCEQKKYPATRRMLSETEELSLIYGIPTEGLIVYEDIIQRNEFLSDILLDCNVPYVLIDELAKKSEAVFPVSKMMAGKPYYVLSDTLQNAKYLIYHHTPVQYVVFNLQKGSIGSEFCERELKSELKMVSGIIHSNLYMTLVNNDISPLLALSLSEVFAWQVDFFHLYKGDKFKVIYEEQSVDGKIVGVGQIKAAFFTHHKTDYYAFAYPVKDSLDIQYFDENGEAVKKAFLKAPLKFSRISSRYSKRRFHPVQKRYKPHLGTDYAAPRGTPIRSVGDGTVIAAAYTRGNGRYVKIRHNGTYTTQYLHMSKFAKGISKGVRVQQGQVIGYVGSTGLATGPHLCYRFWKNGKQVDALKQKLPPSEPIPCELEEPYLAFADSVKKIIGDIPYQIQVEDLEQEKEKLPAVVDSSKLSMP